MPVKKKVTKKISKKLNFLSFQDPVEKLASVIEEKSMWQKFGL